MIICPKCNAQLEDGSKFCNICGTAITEQTPQYQQVPPQYQQVPPQYQAQPVYQQPYYGVNTPVVQKVPQKGKCIAGLIIGISALICAVFMIPIMRSMQGLVLGVVSFAVVGFVLSILGISFSVAGKRSLNPGDSGRGMAIIGLVFSIISLVLFAIAVGLLLIAIYTYLVIGGSDILFDVFARIFGSDYSCIGSFPLFSILIH